MASYGYMAKIGMDTSGLQAGLKNINSSLKSTDSELYKVNKSIKTATQAGTDRSDLLKQKEDVLKEAISETSQKLEQLRNIEDNVKNAANSGNISAENYREYQREVSNTEAQLRQYQTQLSQTQQEEQNSAAANQMVVSSLTDVQNAYQKVAADIKEFTDSLKWAADKAISFSKDAVQYSLNVGKSFESSMSQVKAYSGAVGDDFTALENAAKNAGATTSKSAKEAADALGYMALAGWDTEEMLEGLMPIVRASEAGTADLKRTSDLVTDSMSAMGIATSDLSHYLDVCTAAQSNSNTTMTALLEAYVGCGGTLRNLNVPLEESAALLGTLANRGIKASEAGTSLNSILVNLMGANKSARDAMDALGVSAWDAEGNFIGVTNTLKLLDGALENCTEQEKAFFEAKIGGKTQMDTLQALISGVREEYDDLFTTLENADGALENTSKTMQDNLAGSVTTMRSALEALGVEFYDYLEEPARDAVNAVTDALRELTDSVDKGKLGDSLKNLSEKIADLIKKLTDFASEKGIDLVIDGLSDLVDGLSDLVDVLSWVAEHFDEVKAAAAGLGAAFVTFKFAKTAADIQILITTISTLTATAEAGSVAAEALGIAINAIPLVAIGTAAVGAMVAISSMVDAESEALRSTSAWKSEIENNTQSLNDEREAMMASSEEIDKNTKKINENYDKAKDLWEQLQDLCDEEGNVVGAYSDAQTVITELNELTGSQITLIGNQIAGYNDLCTSMDNYIETMRRTALLEATRDAYVGAVERKEELDAAADSARKTESNAKSKRISAETARDKGGLSLTSQLGINIEELKNDPDYQQWATSNEGKKYDIADINGYISFLKWQEGFASANRLAAEGAVKENEDILKKYEETATWTPDTQTASSKEPQKTSAQLDAEDNAAKNQQAMREQEQKKKDDVLDDLQKLNDRHDTDQINEDDYYAQLQTIYDENKELFQDEPDSDFWKLTKPLKSYNKKSSSKSSAEVNSDDPERIASQKISSEKNRLENKKAKDENYTEEDYYNDLEEYINNNIDRSTEAYIRADTEIANGRRKLLEEADKKDKEDAKESAKNKAVSLEKEAEEKAGDSSSLEYWTELEKKYRNADWTDLEKGTDSYLNLGNKISEGKKKAGTKEYTDEYDDLAERYKQNIINEEQYQKELLDLKQKYADLGIDISKHIAEQEQEIYENKYTDEFDALAKQYEDGLISEEEYQRRKLELQEKYAEKEIDISKHIAEKEKEIDEKRLEDVKKKYDDLNKEIDKRADELAKGALGSGKLYEEKDVSGGGKKKIFTDLNKKKAEIQKYTADLQKLRDSGIPADLMDEILAMDYDDRKDVISELLKMTSEKRELYYSDYTAYHAAAKEAAQLEYSDEKAAIDEELSGMADSALAKSVDMANQYGKEAAQAYLDGYNEIMQEEGLPILHSSTGKLKTRSDSAEKQNVNVNVNMPEGKFVSGDTPIQISIAGQTVISTVLEKMLTLKGLSGRNNNKM